MKNIIYLITLILFTTTTIAFSQIEKVDTFILKDLRQFSQSGDIYIDLDNDSNDDIKFDNTYMGERRSCSVKSLNNKINITIDTIYEVPTSPLNSTIFLRLGNRCGTNTNYLYYSSINILYKTAVTKPPSVYSTGRTLTTGINLIPLRLNILDTVTNTYNYKSVILIINKDSIVEKYSIEGWYINHTLNEPLSCDLIYNDSIINSYTTILPVELIYFSVQENKNNNVELNWQTGSEENNKGFEVQHSYNGIDFETIEFVPSKSPNGTTFDYSDYSFIDENPINGINYYRLKQIDFDGNFDYSQIEAVEINKFIGYNPFFSYLIGLNISPNPTKDFVRLEIFFNTPVHLTVKVVDLNGKVLETRNRYRVRRKEITFDVSNYPSGMYFIQIISDNYSIAKKFVVVK